MSIRLILLFIALLSTSWAQFYDDFDYPVTYGFPYQYYWPAAWNAHQEVVGRVPARQDEPLQNRQQSLFPFNQRNTFGACATVNGTMGTCTPMGLCGTLYRGSPIGFCTLGSVCCTRITNTCGDTVTLNNTIWQSPIAVNQTSACPLNIQLSTGLIEQSKPICQIRLDFLSFSIAQPGLDSVCSTDNFVVFGATNKIPVICGDNAGQHMYLNVPPSTATANQIQLSFLLGNQILGGIARNWAIKIALLPCGANYLAPANCLQYFTATSGTFKSFNYADVTPNANAVRQLANQDYHICLRDELIIGQVASVTCITPCATQLANAKSFSVFSDATVASGNSFLSRLCSTDYLSSSGRPFVEVSTNAVSVPVDRVCGSVASSWLFSNAITLSNICILEKPFDFRFVTDGNEVGDVGNTGFCLNFQQRATAPASFQSFIAAGLNA